MWSVNAFCKESISFCQLNVFLKTNICDSLPLRLKAITDFKVCNRMIPILWAEILEIYFLRFKHANSVSECIHFHKNTKFVSF